MTIENVKFILLLLMFFFMINIVFDAIYELHTFNSKTFNDYAIESQFKRIGEELLIVDRTENKDDFEFTIDDYKIARKEDLRNRIITFMSINKMRFVAIILILVALIRL